jgi:hypothetical protein
MGRRSKKSDRTTINAETLSAVALANPFVQRMIEDAELRSHLNEAVGASKRVFSRLSSSKSAAQALVEDRKLQSELHDALASLHRVTSALAEPVAAVAEKRRRRRGRKLLLLTAGGTVVSFAAVPSLRNKALDKLFGAEEEFQYSPPPGASTSYPDSSAPAESPLSAV